MKKIFKLENLDCANCAAKIERKISKIGGVENASVNFLTQKISFECDDGKYDEILNSVLKAVSSVEPDCKVIVK